MRPVVRGLSFFPFCACPPSAASQSNDGSFSLRVSQSPVTLVTIGSRGSPDGSNAEISLSRFRGKAKYSSHAKCCDSYPAHVALDRSLRSLGVGKRFGGNDSGKGSKWLDAYEIIPGNHRCKQTIDEVEALSAALLRVPN